jgi:hypothetical protein
MWGWATLAALGALAAWACGRVFVGYGPAPVPHRALRPRELATLAAVSETLFPPGGEIPPSGSDAGIAAYVDRLVAASQPRQRRLMRSLFFLIEHGTLAFPAPGGLSGRRRFSSLEPGQREAVLDAWQHSGWFLRRLVFTSLRALCTLGYFADPAVLRRLRLAPYAIDTPVCEADVLYPRVGAPLSSIPYAREDLTPPSDGTPIDVHGPWLAGFAENPEEPA